MTRFIALAREMKLDTAHYQVTTIDHDYVGLVCWRHAAIIHIMVLRAYS